MNWKSFLSMYTSRGNPKCLLSIIFFFDNINRSDKSLAYNNLQKQFMSDADRLIGYHAEQEDRQMCEQYDFLQDFSTSLSIYVPEPAQQQDMCQEMDSDHEQISDEQTPVMPVKEPVGQAVEDRRVLPGKKSPVQKSNTSEADSQQSFSQTDISIRRRRARRVKDDKPYPTKNFLQNFKSPHLEFLRKFRKMSISQFYSIPLLKRLKQKNGMSLPDYQELYSVEEFFDAFEAMFASRYLYRDLMLSRSHVETKQIHQTKIYVFERAFRTKIFKKIN